jgi:hypothetical protein
MAGSGAVRWGAVRVTAVVVDGVGVIVVCVCLEPPQLATPTASAAPTAARGAARRQLRIETTITRRPGESFALGAGSHLFPASYTQAA